MCCTHICAYLWSLVRAARNDRCATLTLTSSDAKPGGNIRLVEALAKDIPIFYDHVVSGIDYCEGGVTLHTAQQSFTGALHPLARNVPLL